MGPLLVPAAAASDYWGAPLHCAVWRGRVDPEVVAGRRKFGRKAPGEVAERVGHRERREEILGLLQLYSRREPSNEPSQGGVEGGIA
jgi:hypothetical protein